MKKRFQRDINKIKRSVLQDANARGLIPEGKDITIVFAPGVKEKLKKMLKEDDEE